MSLVVPPGLHLTGQVQTGHLGIYRYVLSKIDTFYKTDKKQIYQKQPYLQIQIGAISIYLPAYLLGICCIDYVCMLCRNLQIHKCPLDAPLNPSVDDSN